MLRDRVYGDLRHGLEKSGQPIGGNDLILVAQTLALDAILVTANGKEFAQVPGLKFENRMRA